MKRYAVVGTGGRVMMFLDPIATTYREEALIVGFCDPSATRMRFHRDRLVREFSHPDIPLYAVEDFDRMIAEVKPDSLIVCSIDATHHDYILRGLAAGCEVICEKPITTDTDKCRMILAALPDNSRSVRISLNYRWVPGVTKVYELLRSGVIGMVQQINYEYLLDTSHGADYFRRWHASMEQSGGLLVHKSTHHFDLVNWWLDSLPSDVMASARLAFYGRENAIRRGQEPLTRYKRYTGLAGPEDPFRLDLAADEQMKKLYLEAESDNGYLRDKNVFSEGIDIYDAMSVIVNYRCGAILNYSLNAFSPYEGFRVSFAGDRGRLEYEEIHNTTLAQAHGAAEPLAKPGKRLRIFPHFQSGYEMEVEEMAGGHGGGDILIQQQMFAAQPPIDPWNRGAGPRQAIASAIIGIAANISIQEGRKVPISELIELAPQADSLREIW